MRKHIVVIYHILVLAYPHSVVAQPVNLGLPPVTHYPKTLYQAGTQSWDCGQDKRGLVFLANNEGLLCFNGDSWHCYPISNKTCVRSLAIDTSSGNIYVGGQGELGYFSPDALGKLQYQSLNLLIPVAERSYGDVWDIVPFQGAYFFRTADRIFRIKGQKCTIYRPPGSLEHLEEVHGQLLLHSAAGGLFRFDGNQFVPLCPGPSSVVTALLPWRGDTILVTTLKHGIFCLNGGRLLPWVTPSDAFLKEKRIYTATIFGDNQIALGTTLGGLVVLHANRNPAFWLRKGAGLQYNNILNVQADRLGNLWLGLDNGIDYVEMNAPFYRIFPDHELEGAGYAARLFGDRLYLGTSNGLYTLPWRNYFSPFIDQPFQLVTGTTGQVWGLNEAGGTFLLGHHEGAFKVEGAQATVFSNRAGTWRYLQINDTVLIAGQYDGLSLFTRKPDENWQLRMRLPGFGESCRILAPDNDSMLWVSHPYRGVFRVQLHDNYRRLTVRRYGQAEGLPSELFNYVFYIGGRALVAGEHGLFRYDAAADRFVSAPEFDAQLGKNNRTRFLQEDATGNIWFVTGEETGVLWIDDEGLGKKNQATGVPATQRPDCRRV